ncbi:MAG: hypothetical protein ACKVT2_20320 [Saprospiraceae bacterium]
MKYQFLIKTLPATMIVLLLAFTLQGQTNPATKSKAAPLNQESVEASDDVTDAEYSKDLNLTPEQKAEFKKANKAYKAKTKAVKNAKKEELQRLREERIQAHKATLNPEQLKKYDEMLAKKAEKRKAKAAKKQEKKAAKKAEKKAEKKPEKKDSKGKK